MSSSAEIMSGIILITIPTIQFGGHFLLTVLTRGSGAGFTPFQKGMFRAGHAHAGVLVILSLVIQILLDSVGLEGASDYLVRAGAPLSALLISGGFFAAAAKKGAERPGKGILLVFIGSGILAVTLIAVGLLLLDVI